MYKGREGAKGLLVWGLQLNVRTGEAQKREKKKCFKQNKCGVPRGETVFCVRVSVV